MTVGEYKGIARRVCVLVAALLLATATVLLMGVLTAEKPASAQSTLSGGYVASCDGESLYLNAYEKSTYELHNQTRASNGLATLCVHRALTEAAQYHSQEMIDKGYFDHNSYDGESFSARLERFGYDSYEEVGENIAWGSGTNAYPESIFQIWMNSSEHQENILSPNYREVGIGTATGECEGYSGCTMYTVDFGVLR
ncbi:MAG: CAP domain-containing protein [Actinomycetota bacterium]|nr:CAP domain-containing protein [Actinomycetota bacterium]